MKTTNALKICIYEYDGSQYKTNSATIPAGSDDTFSVTCVVSSSTTAFWIGIEFNSTQNQGEYFYTDNWSLTVIQ